MEENKNSNKIAVVAIAIFVIFALMGGFVAYKKVMRENNESANNESKPNKNESLINPELADAVLFAKKDNTKLVAIMANGDEKLIYNFSNDFYYDYDQNENVIYLFLINNSEKFLASIDLKDRNGNYKLETIKKVDLSDSQLGFNMSEPAYIAKIGNNIYFSIRELYKYDIETKNYEAMNISSEKRTMWLLKHETSLIYNIGSDIYVLNTLTNKSVNILSNAGQAYVYNNQLVYRNYDDSSYYTYDFVSGEKQKITNLVNDDTMDKEYIIPFADGIYSFSGLSLYRYKDNNIEKIHTFTCVDFSDVMKNCKISDLQDISNFVKISSNSLIIILGDYVYDPDETFTFEFNLSAKKVTAANGRNVNQYLNEYYLK